MNLPLVAAYVDAVVVTKSQPPPEPPDPGCHETVPKPSVVKTSPVEPSTLGKVYC